MKRLALIFAAVSFAASAFAQERTDDGPRYRLDSAVVTDRLPLLGKGNNYVYTPSKAAAVVTAIGEPDIVRQLVTLPGVSAGIEGSLGLYVRGGNAGGNRLELDGVPVYNATHLLGMFSSITPEIVSSAQVKTGGFDAGYGNYTSAVIQTSLKSNPVDKTHIVVSASPFVGSVFLETPGAAAFKIGARYSPIPQIGSVVTGITSKRSGYSSSASGLVYDLTASLSWDIGKRDRVSLAAFSANDRLNVTAGASVDVMAWNSWMGKASWSHRYSETGSFDLLFYGTGSGSEETAGRIAERSEDNVSFTVKDAIKEFAGVVTLSGDISARTRLRGGLEFKHMAEALNAAAFADLGVNQTDRLKWSAGFRYTFHFGDSYFNGNYDLHLLADYDLSRNLGIECSFDRNTQYYHLLEGLPAGWSLNLSAPINEAFPEEISNQFYSGLFSAFELAGLTAHANAGFYYRRMKNLVSYTSSTNMFRNINDTWYNDVSRGTGRSYGMESSMSLDSDRFSMNMAYTLSRTTRNFPEINDGRDFRFKFDRTHILNLQAQYKVLDRTRPNGRKSGQNAILDVQLSSGNLMTTSIRRYEGTAPPFWSDGRIYIGSPVAFYENTYGRFQRSDYNGVSMPTYFRIDIGYSFEFETRKARQSIALTVFNVLNRHNPYLIFNDAGTWKQLSVMPILPAIRWRAEF